MSDAIGRRRLCFDAARHANAHVHRLRGCNDLVQAAAFFVERAADISNERLMIILEYGSGDSLEAFWAEGERIAAYLIDGTLPTDPPPLAAS